MKFPTFSHHSGCAVALLGAAVVVSLLLAWVGPTGCGSRPIGCADHLRQLGAVYTAETIEKGPPPYSGAALFLYYRQKFYVTRGQEQVLTCPHDDLVWLPRSADQAEAWDTLDLTDPVVVRLHCSYAVRDFERFPIDPKSTSAQIIACDAGDVNGRSTHHPDGLNVLYDDGTVQFRDRGYLGLGPAAPIVVGPTSTVELLRMVTAPTPAALSATLSARGARPDDAWWPWLVGGIALGGIAVVVVRRSVRRRRSRRQARDA